VRSVLNNKPVIFTKDDEIVWIVDEIIVQYTMDRINIWGYNSQHKKYYHLGAIDSIKDLMSVVEMTDTLKSKNEIISKLLQHEIEAYRLLGTMIIKGAKYQITAS